MRQSLAQKKPRQPQVFPPISSENRLSLPLLIVSKSNELAGFLDCVKEIGCQLSVISYQLSVVSCQLSVVSCLPRLCLVSTTDNLFNEEPLAASIAVRGFSVILHQSAGYLDVKSKNHQPSSHSKDTFRHPNGTCGYG